MDTQGILFHRVDNLEFSPWCQPVRNAMVGKQAGQRNSVHRNYLPGLRAVERETESYFDNDFMWLGS